MKYLLPVAILGVLVVTSLLLLMNRSADQFAHSQNEAQRVAEDWIRALSPTFTHDGENLILQDVEVRIPESEYEFMFSFDSRTAGYGDRSNEPVASVITPHEINVVVTDGAVTSAVTDTVYDEVRGQLITEEDTATPPEKPDDSPRSDLPPTIEPPAEHDTQEKPSDNSSAQSVESDLCLSEPYEEIVGDIPPCDAITIGYYFDGDTCKQTYLGCYGVFPFETLEECKLQCE